MYCRERSDVYFGNPSLALTSGRNTVEREATKQRVALLVQRTDGRKAPRDESLVVEIGRAC